MSGPKVLVPFDRAEALSIAEAVQITGRSDDTVRRWASIHHLGRRIGGRWFVSRIALQLFLDGDRASLRDHLSGAR